MIYDKIVPVFNMIDNLIKTGKTDTLAELFETTMPTLKLEMIKEDVANCTSCNLCTTCPHVAFEGNMQADIMFVGESPSEYDFQSMKPFSGPTGLIFQNMIKAAKDNLTDKFESKNIWMTNVLKCRPVDKDGKTTKPTLAQIASCKAHLDREIALVNPKLIICLGAVAAEILIHPKFKLTEEHGKLFGNNTKVLATFSPGYVAYLGENTPQGIDIKCKMWQDLKAASEYLNSLDVPVEINEEIILENNGKDE